MAGGTYGFEQRSFSTLPVRIFFVVALLLTVFIWAILLTPDHGGWLPRPFIEHLLIDFINVGQGDAILIRTPLGRNFLVDAGQSVTAAEARAEGRELVHNYLRTVGVDRLHGIVVTHPHNDHIAGVIPLLKRRLPIDRIWDCGAICRTPAFQSYIELTDQRRIPRVTVRAGDVLDWDRGLFVQVLHPEKVAPSEGESDLNNDSVTLLIRYGKFSCLLTGDIEDDAQRQVARYGPDLGSLVLKVPHHGSNTSINRPFLDFVKPRLAVIQVGRGNPFGHPTQQMLALYQQIGVRVYRNDYHGTVRLIVDGRTPDDFTVQVDRER